MNIGRYLNTWNVILVLVFIVLFFAVLYPVLYIFKASFMDPETGVFSLNSYQTFFKYPYYLRCLRNSLFVSALAAGFALVIGIPFAFFLSRYDLPGKDIIKTLGTLPLVTPAILSGALVVFYLSIENFGVPILIGEDFRVLSVQAYNEFISEMGGNPSMAGALSMILLSLTLLLTVVQKYWTERKTYATTSVQRTAVKRLSLLPTVLIRIFCAGLVFIALFPFLVVVVAAFTKAHGPVMYYGQFTLDHFIKAFTIAPRPILNSFFLATAATLIGIVFGLVVSYLLVRQRGTVSYLLDVLTMLPLAIAGTVQGIALAVAYNKGLVVLTGTWMILVLAYFIRKVPFSIKTTSALLRQIDRNIEDASVNLGVPPFRSFLKVILPVMMPGIRRRGDHHVGDDPGRAQFHHRPVLRPLGDHDRGDLPEDQQRRFRARLRLRHGPHRLGPDPPVHPAQTPGQGSDDGPLSRC